MKICFNCNEQFTKTTWICPHCNHTPALLEGHYAFAPELAKESTGFEAKFFAPLAAVEANNFWFRARNQLIIWALNHYFPNARNFLEIGCGTGFVLSGIQQALPNMHLSGSEIFNQGLEFAKQRVIGADLFQMDARKIPFADEFAVIGAFDVLEINTMNKLQLEYEQDFYSWIYKNIEILKQRKFSELDVDILIDELESMAKRDRRELISRLMVLIAHLLKWQFQPTHRSGSWRGSICEQRIKIAQQLKESPSLKNQLIDGVKSAYPDALELATKETRLASTVFPNECQYLIEQLLDKDFYPNP